MEKVTHQFAAGSVAGGAVSMDGDAVTIEFEAGDERLWLTLPAECLGALSQLAAALDGLRHDAKNGVASSWHVAAGKQT